MLTASMLYAQTQSQSCTGPYECHWCSSPCTQEFYANDPVIPFIKNPHHPKRPGNSYICKGCWLYRRKRLTVNWLHGEWTDRRCLMDHSWYLTENGIYVVGEMDRHLLYQKLLKPPTIFCLSLLDRNESSRSLAPVLNHIHLSICNQLQEIHANTTLHFTLNNIPHTYTIYEFEQAIKYGTVGKEPGVHILYHFLGIDSLPNEEEEPKQGRPITEDTHYRRARRKIR